MTCGVGRGACGVCCVSQMISRPLIGHKYECYIVIEVTEVNKLDEGNKLSSLSTSMTQYLLKQKNIESQSRAVPHSVLN